MNIRDWLIPMLAAVFLIVGCPAWTHAHGAVQALCYPLFHANVFHLAVNSLALWTVFNPKRTDNVRVLIWGAAISLAVYPLAVRPVVGISNLLYAAIGMHSPSFRNRRYWLSEPVMTFNAVTLIMLFIPQFSAVTHIAAYILGIGVSSLYRYISKIKGYAGS